MNRTFTSPVWWKLIYGALSTLLLGGAVYIIFHPVYPTLAGKILAPAVLAYLAVTLCFKQLMNKVIVNPDRITSVEGFKSTTIATADIRGVRVVTTTKGPNLVNIEMKGGKPGLSISADLEGIDELVTWLKGSHTDLNAKDKKESDKISQLELKEILADTHLGATTEERKQHLDKAKSRAKWYNILGTLLVVPGLFIDNTYYLLFMLMVPVFGIVLVATSSGLIKYNTRDNGQYSNVAAGMFLGSMILVMKMFGHGFHYAHFSSFWLPYIAMVAVLIFVMKLSLGKEILSMMGQRFVIVVIALVYGIGATVNMNFFFDHSAEQVYPVEVLAHHVYETSKGGHTYYVTLEKWGEQTDSQDEEVSFAVYNAAPLGGKVAIHLTAGFLHIPLYRITAQ